MILRARYIATAVGPPIENGVLEILGGRIARIERRHGPAPHDAIDYGDAVLCPGFINAHTHLELSSLAGRVAPTANFPDWLLRVIRRSAEILANDGAIHASIMRGVGESLSAGVTAVGDITRNPALARALLAQSPLTVVSFGEVTAMGARRSLAGERIAAAIARVHAATNVRIGISPHAPYSVEPDILRRCAELAIRHHVPISIHAAESAEETQFTQWRTGPFTELLRSLGIWDEAIPTSGLSPIALLSHVGLLGPRCVLAHANYLVPGDPELVRASGASVVYCPRTHTAFGHVPHPFRELLAAGVNVCLATDSLASNPSLSVLDEARFVLPLAPEVNPERLLAMITTSPARALGLEAEHGALESGKRGDVNVLALSSGDPWEAVFERDDAPIQTYIAGNAVERISERR